MNSSEARPLGVPRLSTEGGEVLSRLLVQGVTLFIDQGNWDDFTDPRVQVSLTLAYDQAGVWLYYQVQEPEIRAVVDRDQGPVYQDSCVEWFVVPPSSSDYLNFEWNSKGYLLHYRGPDRYRRTPASEKTLERVLRSPVGSPTGTGWSLLAQVPFVVLGVTDPTLGLWRANFYKCGDLLARPHYYSWQKIDTPNPDFHRPENFGFLEFL